MKHFEYHQPTKIVFGSGRISEAGEIVKTFGSRCLLVTTPPVPATAAQFDRVKEIFRSSGVDLAHFDQVIPNPTTETSAGVTLPHGMGMAIGGMYPHVAHGESLAIVYPACTKFTYASAERQYSKMARILNSSLDGLSDQEAAKASVEEVKKLLQKVGLYKKLRDVNMPEEEIEALAKQCMVLPDYQGNPRVASEEEMVELVRDSY